MLCNKLRLLLEHHTGLRKMRGSISSRHLSQEVEFLYNLEARGLYTAHLKHRPQTHQISVVRGILQTHCKFVLYIRVSLVPVSSTLPLVSYLNSATTVGTRLLANEEQGKEGKGRRTWNSRGASHKAIFYSSRGAILAVDFIAQFFRVLSRPSA